MSTPYQTGDAAGPASASAPAGTAGPTTAPGPAIDPRTGAVAAMAGGAIESFVMATAGEMPRGIRINAASPTVLESAAHFHEYFPGFPPASDEAVGNLYRRSVESIDTGKTYVLD